MGTLSNNKYGHVRQQQNETCLEDSGSCFVVVWSIWLERNIRICEDLEEYVEDVWSKVKLRLAWWITGIKSLEDFISMM